MEFRKIMGNTFCPLEGIHQATVMFFIDVITYVYDGEGRYKSSHRLKLTLPGCDENMGTLHLNYFSFSCLHLIFFSFFSFKFFEFYILFVFIIFVICTPHCYKYLLRKANSSKNQDVNLSWMI